MNQNYFLIYLLLINSFSQAQTRTVGVVKYDKSQYDGYCLYAPNGTKKTFLIDKCGRKVNEWNSDFSPGLSVHLSPDAKLYRSGVYGSFGFGGGVGGVLEKYNWDGDLLWQYKCADSNQSFHHDFKVLPSGNILAIVWEKHSIKDAIDNGRDPANTKYDIWSERIDELEPIGKDSAKIVWQWRVWDHMVQNVDSTKLNYGNVANHRELFDINFSNGNNNKNGQDWLHFNSIDYNEQLDQILISCHSLDEIYIIDHSTSTEQASSHSLGRVNLGGDILYRWGNSPSYQTGSSANHRLFRSHHATWIPQGQVLAGNILIFNNGLNRPGGNYSSIDIIVPPLKPNGSYTITPGSPYLPDSQNVVYKAPKKNEFFSMFMGGVYPIKDGRYLVTNAMTGTFFEVAKNDTNIKWKYINPLTPGGNTNQYAKVATNSVFRMEFYPPNYSAFFGKTLTSGDEIESKPDTVKLCDKPLPPFYSIFKINKQNTITGVADSLGTKCRLSGTVQSVNLATGNVEFIIADKTGSIRVYHASKNFGKIVNAGDSFMVQGAVLQDKGWCTLGNLDTLVKLGSSKKTIKATAALPLEEKQESTLIKFAKVKLKTPSTWPTVALTKNQKKTLAVIDAAGKIDSLRIYEATDIDGTPAPIGYFDVQGFVGQADNTNPFLSNYFLIPSKLSDFTTTVYASIEFKSAVDTANNSQDSFFALAYQTAKIDGISFEVGIKGGTAILNQDFFYASSLFQFGGQTDTLKIGFKRNTIPTFTGNRSIVLAIRNPMGPAFVGNDSTVTIWLKGKTENTNSLALFDKNNLQIFPNPSEGCFTVRLQPKIASIAIVDLAGKNVPFTSLDNEGSKSIQIEKAGLYIVKITSDKNQVYQQRLVVVNH